MGLGTARHWRDTRTDGVYLNLLFGVLSSVQLILDVRELLVTMCHARTYRQQSSFGVAHRSFFMTTGIKTHSKFHILMSANATWHHEMVVGPTRYKMSLMRGESVSEAGISLA